MRRELFITLLALNTACLSSGPQGPDVSSSGSGGSACGTSVGNPNGGSVGNPYGGSVGNPFGGSVGNPFGGSVGNPNSACVNYLGYESKIGVKGFYGEGVHSVQDVSINGEIQLEVAPAVHSSDYKFLITAKEIYCNPSRHYRHLRLLGDRSIACIREHLPPTLNVQCTYENFIRGGNGIPKARCAVTSNISSVDWGVDFEVSLAEFVLVPTGRERQVLALFVGNNAVASTSAELLDLFLLPLDSMQEISDSALETD